MATPTALTFALVVVETAPVGRLRDIHSVPAAAEMLLFQWLYEGRGAAYRTALRSCLAALEGKATGATARNTFIAAAQESGVFVREGDGRP